MRRIVIWQWRHAEVILPIRMIRMFFCMAFLLLNFKKGGINMDELLYVIPANSEKEEILNTLKAHPEIKFVSLVGIDMAGNDTDEKIPMRIFLKDIDEFYAGTAVQTDGSSVVLTGIATLNNAKVDMPVDPSVNWFVDYNMENYDEETASQSARCASRPS